MHACHVCHTHALDLLRVCASPFSLFLVFGLIRPELNIDRYSACICFYVPLCGFSFVLWFDFRFVLGVSARSVWEQKAGGISGNF